MKVRVFKRRGKWHIGYRPEGANGPYIRRVMPDERTARRIAKKIEVEVMEGVYLDRRKVSRISFEAAARQYLDLSARTKRSHQRDQTCHRALLRTVFSGCRLSDVTVRQIEDHIAARLDDGVSAQTINHELQFLRNVFRKSIDWGEAHANPAAAVKKLPVRSTRVRYLSYEGEARLLSECSPHLRPMVALAIETGLREGEVLGLTWDDVDLVEGLLHIEDAKGGKRRDVPLSARATATLRSLPRHIRSPYVFHKKYTGKPYGRVDKGMRAATGRAKLKDVVFHTLRHTFASRMIMEGASERALMDICGWSSYAMVQRYTHLSPRHRKNAVAALDRRRRRHENQEREQPQEASGDGDRGA